MTGSPRRIRRSGQTTCYAFVRAKNSVPALPGRGEVVLTVTERPSGRDTVAISAGFPFGKDAAVTMQVDTTGLDFYTAQSNAFARDGKAAVAAFQKGAAGAGTLAGPARRPDGGGHVQPARLFRGLRGDQQGMSGALMSDTASDLTAAERERILAKSALFDPPPVQLADGRRDLVGLSRAELAAEVAAIGEAPFRAKQLWHWIYHQGVTDFSRMSSIARPLQQKLAERFVIGRPEAATVQTSDG